MRRSRKQLVQSSLDEQDEESTSGSVLDQTESDIPQVGIGEVITEEVQPWDVEAVLAEKQMVGDMTELIIDRIKTMPTHWGKMSENQRMDLISSIQAGCHSITSQAIKNIASRGRKIITGFMKQVTIKDEITLAITCQRSPEACSAMGMSAAGGMVAFLLLETEGLLTMGNPIQVGPVQTTMDLDSELDPNFEELKDQNMLDLIERAIGINEENQPQESDEKCPV